MSILQTQVNNNAQSLVAIAQSTQQIWQVPGGGCAITINVNVLDNQTSSPIVGASVTLSNAFVTYTGTTDSSGNVSFTDNNPTLIPAAYNWSSTYVGYINNSGTVGGYPCGASIDIFARQDPGFCPTQALSQVFTVSDSGTGASGRCTYSLSAGCWVGNLGIANYNPGPPFGPTIPLCSNSGAIPLLIRLTRLGAGIVHWQLISTGAPNAFCPVTTGQAGYSSSIAGIPYAEVDFTTTITHCTSYPATVRATCNSTSQGYFGGGGGYGAGPVSSTALAPYLYGNGAGTLSTLNFIEQ